MVPSAVSYWGIPGRAIFTVAFALALYSFVRPLYEKYRWVRVIGRPEPVHGSVTTRWGNVLRQIFGHTKVLRTGRHPLPGVMHLFMFYGFVVMQINNLAIVLEGIFPTVHLPFMEGPLLAVIDLFYLLVLIGCVTFAVIRYGLKPGRLSTGPESLYVLLFIVGLVLTELGTETLRIAVTGRGAEYAWLAARLVPAFTGLAPAVQQVWYNAFWWGHLAVLGGFMWFLPRSKHIHLLVAPFNLYFQPLKPKGELPALNLEDETAESFGVSKLEDFTWKALLDTLACVECGRCQDQCPAHQTGKALSPKKVIVNLKHHLHEKGPLALLMAAGVKPEGLPPGHERVLNTRLIGDVVTEEELWACTTCRACVEACPLGIDPMEKIVEMRRSLVMMEAQFPAEVAPTFRNLEKAGNPWGLPQRQRADWARDLSVPTLAENPEAEYLYWVGCSGSYDARGKEIARAVARLLVQAGVSFAILGAEEKCTGDPARRMGHEPLFQQLAAENAETIKAYGVKKVITHCPHCFNILKNEYRQFGIELTMVHHTELLHHLVKDGRLFPVGLVDETVTYHDSCYLGRYNDVFKAPRELLAAIPGLKVVEMERSGSTSMCCGAGGGRMWMEEHTPARVNRERAREALGTGCGCVATNCPFCLTMLTDGVKAEEAGDRVRVKDVAELLLKSTGEGTGPARGH